MKFQERALHWAVHTFGDYIGVRSTRERALRFIEEAIELVQSIEMNQQREQITREDVEKILNRAYSRNKGNTHQEVGGVVTTLALLCESLTLQYDELGERELIRCWKNVEKIREKHYEKQGAGTAVIGDLPS